MDRDMELLSRVAAEIGPADDATRKRLRANFVTEISDDQPRRSERTSRLKQRSMLFLLAAVVVPGAIAVAAGMRADVGDNFGGFLSEETSGREIGRPVEPSDDPPEWFSGEGFHEQLVIASYGSHDLFMARNSKGEASFALDSETGIVSGGGANPFVNDFQGNSAIPLIVSPSNDGRTTLYAGVLASDVATLELRYSSGPPDVVEPSGAGFIFPLDLGRTSDGDGTLTVDRRPEHLVALNTSGEILQTQPAQCVGGMTALALRSELGYRYDPGRVGEYFENCASGE